MKAISDLLGIGLEPKDLGVLAVCLRAVIVFIVSLVMVRVAHKRFLSKMTAFDVILTFVLASALARAINGSAPFGATLVAGFVLVGLHRGMSALAFHWTWFGNLVKGHASVLVQQGKPEPNTMRKHAISEADLLEEARLNGKVEKIEEIATATLERSGKISVIPVEQ